VPNVRIDAVDQKLITKKKEEKNDKENYKGGKKMTY